MKSHTLGKFYFQMACIWQLECNFLYGFFRCHLPVETVEVEVRITLMQGTHTFRRDRTYQIIKCNPWSTRLHPHPAIIKKMKTYLKLEVKVGPKPQPNPISLGLLNPNLRKDSKVTEKRKRFIPTRKYKVKVMARPNSSNATGQPPLANPKAPENPEGQKPSTEGNQGNNPHH